MSIKNIVRNTLNLLHLDLTKNLEYDRLTKAIMKKNIKSSSNCIDIGCHKGEILEILLKLSPNGTHFAFEPIPSMFEDLSTNFKGKATIFPFALAEQEGSSIFQFVKNAPAYSGLKKRKYNVSNPEIEEIEVEIKRLDSVIPEDTRIDFIKIDVEGAEFDVLKGAKKILEKNKPTIVFEFGKGASDFYGTKPSELYVFFNNLNYKIFTLKSFLNNKNHLSSKEFETLYNENKEYYFIAH